MAKLKEGSTILKDEEETIATVEDLEKVKNNLENKIEDLEKIITELGGTI